VIKYQFSSLNKISSNESSAYFTEQNNNDSKNNSIEKEGKELTGSETFTEEFYYYVNVYRAENGLGYLERDTRAEKVAAEYSEELARIKALLTNRSTSIGAGYVTQNGRSYFTAYLVEPKSVQ
jgi:uncharacterized protein YkwD